MTDRDCRTWDCLKDEILLYKAANINDVYAQQEQLDQVKKENLNRCCSSMNTI